MKMVPSDCVRPVDSAKNELIACPLTKKTQLLETEQRKLKREICVCKSVTGIMNLK